MKDKSFKRVLWLSPPNRKFRKKGSFRKTKAMVITMKIRLNENEEVVKIVKEGLARRGGYCPCRMESSEDTKCICKEFREQIADENFEGYCHCMLYYKEK